TQNNKTIDVYFDQNQLALTGATAVSTPSYYHLINTASGSITLPQSVTYSVDAVTKQAKATLNFASDIPAGTFKLEVGTTYESDDTLNSARHVGNSMVDANGNAAPIQAFLGDSLTLGSATQANDVDLYRFDLQNAVNDFSLTVTPVAGLTSTPSLDAYVRLFNSSGVELQSV